MKSSADCPTIASPVGQKFSQHATGTSQRSSRLRLACTRCHLQKLRCERRATQLSCGRCLKLGTECVFEARAQRNSISVQNRRSTDKIRSRHEGLKKPPTRPPVQTPRDSIEEIDAILSTNDWLGSLELGCRPPDPMDKIECVPENNFQGPVPGHNSFLEAGLLVQGDVQARRQSFESAGSTLRSSFSTRKGANQLNGLGFPSSFDLLSEMEEHGLDTENPIFDTSVHENMTALEPGWKGGSNSFPTLNSTLQQLMTTISTCAEALSGADSRRSSPDRAQGILNINGLLSATTGFIQVLEDVYQSPARTPINSLVVSELPLSHQLVQMDLATHLQNFETPSTELLSEKTSSTGYIDEATLLLISSCHCRLAQIYDSVYKKMEICLKHKVIPFENRNWRVELPALHFGAFSLPSVQLDHHKAVGAAANSSFYTSLVFKTTALLWRRLKIVLKNCESVGSDDLTTSELEGFVLVWARMHERNDKILSIIDQLMSRSDN